MSQNNDLTDVIANFNSDVEKFSELIKCLSDYEQKINKHINKFKKFEELQSVAASASEVTDEWKTIAKVTESIEKSLQKLFADNRFKPQEKQITSQLLIQTAERDENPESRIDVVKAKREQEIEQQSAVDSVVTSNEIKDNGDLLTESTIADKVKANDTKDMNGLNKIKLGTIRVVPLQNLLSTPNKCSNNEPQFPFTISDSDDDDHTLPKKSSTLSLRDDQKHNIFVLSDSDNEQSEHMFKQRVQNGKSQENRVPKSQINFLEKPRKKFTPVRNSADEKVKRFAAFGNEDLVRPAKTARNGQETEDSKKSSQILKENSVSEPNRSEDFAASIIANASNPSFGENRPPLSTTDPDASSLAEASPAIEPVINKPPTIVKSNLKKNCNDFQRKCVVRIKRTPFLTVNNIKNKKQDKKVNTNNTKTMASDSDSETEIVQQIDNTDYSDSSSVSEIVIKRKKRVFQEKKTDSSASSDTESNNRKTSGSERKKRKVIKKSNTSSDDGSDDDDDEKSKKRKKIRKLINEKNLEDGTKRATREEEERKKRIEERQKMYNQIYVKPENVEVDELILDFDESTKKPVLKVDKGLMKKLKPHQVNGVKFMWDACFETVKDCQENPGSGCILAHCMGLGKTMQIVTLAHTLLTHYEVTHVERVLIISPLSTLNNWAREFQHWISFAKKKDIEIYDMSKYKDKNTRVFKLDEWFTEGGVCIVGYDMYRILSNQKTKGLRKKQKESLQKSLVDPGPDIVVCDEGHLLKNEKTSLSQAVTKIRTKRRIVLTGTPLQNNLKEYYCMIQFIKPNLLGTYKEYLNRFVNPITNGQYTDSTARDIRLMKHRSHILHKMLEACIQRRDYSVLAPYLPPKHEYVVFVTLSDMQKQLYGHYMTIQRDMIGEASNNPGKGAKLFQDFQNLRRIWTHPMNLRVNSDTVIKKKLAQYDSEDSLKDFIIDSGSSTSSDSECSSIVEADASETSTLRSRKTRAQRGLSDNESDCVEVQPKDDPSEWWTKFVDDTELNNIHHSPKLVLLMTLLQRCEEIGDKVLVFSQSLQSLDVIEHFLSLIDRQTRGEEIEGNVGVFKGYWRPGVNYFRLDGSRTVENRESMCKSFNNVSNLNSRLFLISTRAGGLGINLVAANRVVIFDVSWNPSHDTQSIFRVYRFGQTKPCYIYRLIGLGTMEQKVYERQVAKQATAKRVIDEQQISRHYNQSDLQELYSYELEPSTTREIPILPKDRLFAELLSNHEKLLFKYHEHDSLLENEDSENLTEEERKAAWDEYEAEKTRPPQPTMQYMSYDRQAFLGHYGNPSGSVTSNKIFGFRSDILLRLLNMKGSQDNPDLTSSQVIQLVPEYLQRLYLEMNNGDPTLYKELLELHKSLEAPGGMYMNPLLFANQTPAPAPAPVIHPFEAQLGQYAQVHPGTSNFNSNEVYEVD